MKMENESPKSMRAGKAKNTTIITIINKSQATAEPRKPPRTETEATENYQSTRGTTSKGFLVHRLYHFHRTRPKQM
jgi:hypothetical protein